MEGHYNAHEQRFETSFGTSLLGGEVSLDQQIRSMCRNSKEFSYTNQAGKSTQFDSYMSQNTAKKTAGFERESQEPQSPSLKSNMSIERRIEMAKRARTSF